MLYWLPVALGSLVGVAVVADVPVVAKVVPHVVAALFLVFS